MNIKITECEGTDAGRGLLRDLAKYECLRDWIQALVDRKFAAQAPCFSYGVSGAVAGFH